MDAHSYSRFCVPATNKETEAQRNLVICPKSHGGWHNQDAYVSSKYCGQLLCLRK